MRSLILTLAILVSASAQAEDARAVIAAPTESPAGELVVLDGSASTGDTFAWSVFPRGKPLFINGKQAAFSTSSTGEYTFSLLSVGLLDGQIKISQADHVVRIGPVPPGPDPNPDPNPGPIPNPTPGPIPNPTPGPNPSPTPGSFEAIGSAYARSLVGTYATAWEQSADKLGRGVTRDDVMKGFPKLWETSRIDAFRTVAARFADVAPDGREPTASERVRLENAWREFAVGLRQGIKP